MQSKLLGTVLTYLTARSPKLRRFSPLIPLALAGFAFLRNRRANAARMTPAMAR